MTKRSNIQHKEHLRTWKQVDPGAQVMTPGSSVNYRSSDWSSVVSEFLPENCIQCLQCWVFCPDNCITVEDQKVTGIDEFYCKGCGICVEICPTDPKSLKLVPVADKE
jgi:pyruvate ferredoxin oxidoreductase delta subunit